MEHFLAKRMDTASREENAAKQDAERNHHCALALRAGPVLGGFYKVRFTLNDAAGRSVMYAHGQILRQFSFAHIGTIRETGGDHHRGKDLATIPTCYRPLAGADEATLPLRGREDHGMFY